MHIDIFETFEILEHSLLPMPSQKSVCSGVSSPVDCRLWSYKFIKRKLSYIRFSWKFLKFLVQLFQNTLMKTSVMKFSTNLGCWQYSFALIKKWLPQRQFLEVFRDEIFLKETFVMFPILVATFTISKSRIVQKRCPSAYCGKC